MSRIGKIPFIHGLYASGILKKAVTGDGGARTEVPLRRPSRLVSLAARGLASALFVGYVPAAQGTVGSLWIPFLYLVLPEDRSGGFIGTSLAVTVAAVVLYFAGVWASGVCEILWGRDPGRVVIDEVVGMLVAVAFVPLTWKSVWLGFFLFRFFDIFKPPPIRRVEAFHGGWGVMNDDVVAGSYANVVLRILLRLL